MGQNQLHLKKVTYNIVYKAKDIFLVLWYGINLIGTWRPLFDAKPLNSADSSKQGSGAAGSLN